MRYLLIALVLCLATPAWAVTPPSQNEGTILNEAYYQWNEWTVQDTVTNDTMSVVVDVSTDFPSDATVFFVTQVGFLGQALSLTDGRLIVRQNGALTQGSRALEGISDSGLTTYIPPLRFPISGGDVRFTLIQSSNVDILWARGFYK